MTKEELKEVAKVVIKEELGPLFVEREQHYQDHCFVKDIREGVSTLKSTACKTILLTLIPAFFVLLLWGVSSWIKKHI